MQSLNGMSPQETMHQWEGNENYYEMVAVTFDCKKVGHENEKCKDTLLHLMGGKMKQPITKYRSNSPSPSVLLELHPKTIYQPG